MPREVCYDALKLVVLTVCGNAREQNKKNDGFDRNMGSEKKYRRFPG